MNVLFVCKHNRFRSKVAEALLKHYLSKDSGINVQSAGVKLDLPFVAENVKKVLKEYRITKLNNKPRVVNPEMLNRVDKIIIVADNVSPDLFPREKVEVWPVSDCSQNDEDGIRERIRQIDIRIRNLLKRLKK